MENQCKLGTCAFHAGLLQEMNRIQTWMRTNETHEYCNAFSLVLLCEGTDKGQLWDYKKKKISSIKKLTEEISGIVALHKKPKLILIQRCVGKTSKYD